MTHVAVLLLGMVAGGMIVAFLDRKMFDKITASVKADTKLLKIIIYEHVVRLNAAGLGIPPKLEQAVAEWIRARSRAGQSADRPAPKPVESDGGKSSN